jgi:hypothetical protein
MVINHDMTITGLLPTTLYRFKVVSADAAGNMGASAELSFTTLATPDTTAPNISSLGSSSVTTSSAHVTWTTNEPATGKVWYATTTPVNTGTALSVTSGGLVLNHDLTLSGLVASSTYYYKAMSADAANNSATSGELNFMTQ